MRGVALNIGANTNAPGFRGPIYGDGSFEYIPIPETEPIADDRTVPSYADLDLAIEVSDVADIPVHHDPTFAGVHNADRYTYGDPYGVKARPLLNLTAGDIVFFYATLTATGRNHADWITTDWGAYVIGQFHLQVDPVSKEAYHGLSAAEKTRFESNAHVKRATYDAEVLLLGDPSQSTLYDTAIPLSTPTAGTEPNALVTEYSSDSGRGPWWRRPLRFDSAGVTTLLDITDHDDVTDALSKLS